jgi:hypothetical protein
MFMPKWIVPNHSAFWKRNDSRVTLSASETQSAFVKGTATSALEGPS